MPELQRADPVLAVHDLERTATWMREVFGTANEEVDPGNWVFCRTEHLVFMLGHCPDAVPASEIGDHSYHSYLRVDDVDAFHERALAAGANVMHPPTDEPWGMREMSVRSPDGHRFMLGQPVRES